jgi:hypothetical protein
MKIKGKRTYISIAIVLIIAVAKMFGVEFSGDELGQLANNGMDLAQLASGIAAFYYRAKTDKIEISMDDITKLQKAVSVLVKDYKKRNNQ